MTTTSKPRCTVERNRNLQETTIALYLNPVPASRPRVTRWGTYYTKTYKTWKAAAEQAIPYCDPKYLLTGNVSAFVMINVMRPKTTKRLNPRGDIDNYLKAIFDAVVGTKKNPKGYLVDDDQITTLTAHKRFVTENPHFLIRLTPEE